MRSDHENTCNTLLDHNVTNSFNKSFFIMHSSCVSHSHHGNQNTSLHGSFVNGVINWIASCCIYFRKRERFSSGVLMALARHPFYKKP